MAATLTVNGQINHGHTKKVFGTFSATIGETSGSYTGFDVVTDYEFRFDSNIAAPNVKAVIAPPTVTWTFDDLPAATTGTWFVEGR